MEPARVTRLDDLERIRIRDLVYMPIRRPLGATAFAVNAYTAEPGQEIIEAHDETSPGAGRHEELYVVLSGHAASTVGEQAVDAPAGTMILVPVETHRAAIARDPGTVILAIGAPPGAALPPSPFEHWYFAQPAFEAGDHDRAIAIASEGLRDHPGHGTLNYQLACYHAAAGRADEALRHLDVALANEPRAREWARTDTDLDPLRDDPRFPAV
jgi:quercetin dioxygenase-like cupin family protein